MGRGEGSGWGVRVDVNEEQVFVKIQKKNWGGGGGGLGGVRVDVNQELKFFGKFKKKKLGGGGGGGGVRLEGQDGCERRIEVFVKIQKKNIFFLGGGGGGGGVAGVRVDVNEELKFL